MACPPARDLLDFERLFTFRQRGAKVQAIRDLFDLTEITYLQCLAWAITTPEALAADPVTTHRLTRLRDRGRPGLRG